MRAGLPLLAISVTALLLTACVMKPGLPERTPDGLTRIVSKRVDTVYVASGMSLAPYRRVMLDPVDVAFRRDWQRNHPNITGEDIDRIRSEVATLFHEVFARELEQRGGYAITDQPGADVLRVTAQIVDLDIAAPETRTAGRVQSYVVSAGEMTLLAELRDSQSGAILVRAADHEKGREFGNLQIANRVTNSAEAQRAFAMWAGLLRDALDSAEENATASR